MKLKTTELNDSLPPGYKKIRIFDGNPAISGDTEWPEHIRAPKNLTGKELREDIEDLIVEVTSGHEDYATGDKIWIIVDGDDCIEDIFSITI